MPMKRDQCLKVLARHRTDEVVVPIFTAAQEWIAIAPSDLNFTFVGAMGLGSSHALGIALGRPDRKVIVLDGDGSLLMNLGSLVTIARAAPRNLIHCVCRNGTYETNGAIAIPARDATRFSRLALEAGYRAAHEFSDLADWERRAAEVLGAEGPVLVELEVEPGASYPENFPRLYDLNLRERFRAALAAKAPA